MSFVNEGHLWCFSHYWLLITDPWAQKLCYDLLTRFISVIKIKLVGITSHPPSPRALINFLSSVIKVQLFRFQSCSGFCYELQQLTAQTCPFPVLTQSVSSVYVWLCNLWWLRFTFWRSWQTVGETLWVIQREQGQFSCIYLLHAFLFFIGWSFKFQRHICFALKGKLKAFA